MSSDPNYPNYPSSYYHATSTSHRRGHGQGHGRGQPQQHLPVGHPSTLVGPTTAAPPYPYQYPPQGASQSTRGSYAQVLSPYPHQPQGLTPYPTLGPAVPGSYAQHPTSGYGVSPQGTYHSTASLQADLVPKGYGNPAGYGNIYPASHSQSHTSRSQVGRSSSDATASSARHTSVDVGQLTQQLGGVSLHQGGSGRSKSHHSAQGTSLHGKDTYQRADLGAPAQASSSRASQTQPVLTEAYRNWAGQHVSDPQELVASLHQATDWKTARSIIKPQYFVTKNKADDLARSYSLYHTTKQPLDDILTLLAEFVDVITNGIPSSLNRPFVATVVEYNGQLFFGTSCPHILKNCKTMTDRLLCLGLSEEGLDLIRRIGRDATFQAGNCGEVRAFGDALQAGGYAGTMRAVSLTIKTPEAEGKAFCAMCRIMSCQLVRAYPGLKIIDVPGKTEYNTKTVSRLEKSVKSKYGL